MISADYSQIICDTPDCTNSIKNHAWGKIKAEGWVFLKNDSVFCPDHKPEWYTKWKGNR